ncbi:ribonuclease H-like domain-containing protein [Nitratireductor thuwali]|uniref:YprB ribonuclease H-like domain-containing protein n=1 Tax=Nitratireductor thuwali TaxID=2267699 RepID=A0ABY5MP36_9HYPH|nr:hypothetical protein NTH_02868 [Nitratireductor thuwali]
MTLLLEPQETPKWQHPRALPSKLKEQLALCRSLPERVLFLDIETTGLSHYYDEITVIGWSIAGRSSTIVKGQCHHRLIEDAKDAVALVTFNGIRFDQRFLQKEFPDVTLPEAHIDLMYLCRRVGLTGGQKAIEKVLDLRLRDEIADVDGFAAVLLWHRYLRGDVAALEKLIRYNRADIAAMGAIFDHVLARLLIEPDLFEEPVEFESWAAPAGWTEIPSFEAAGDDLSAAPDFDQLLSDGPASTARIVGIDLTGSEKRGSGWCMLEGNRASTKTLHTDDEILTQTVACKPHLVSIDSPLCLPSGRTSVEDSDPGRERFGIMRKCERELKRRGVNVYPCLLPSMQKLTERGIRLAKVLRKKGIPVIESYPGAAQDIMRIPRKGGGVEWLKLGLREFGIEGGFIDKNVTHDELDAITSALVGSFHLAGLSEALGSEDEAPLIVPDLRAEPGPIVIGVSGPIAAGKTTFARALECKGYAYTRFSLVIDDILKKRGAPLNRESRQALGQEIQETGKQRWLAEQTIRRVSEAVKIVVDGLRFPEDHAFMVERFGARFHHVHIMANGDVRRQRYQKLGQDVDFDTATRSEVEGRVSELQSLAHEILVNEGAMSAIMEKADAVGSHVAGGKPCRYQS